MEFKHMPRLWRSVLVLLLAGIAIALRAEDQGADVIDLKTVKPAPTPAPAVAPDPKIQALIAQLGAADTIQREEAEKGLIAIGKAAIPLLKEAEKSPNAEVAARAKRLGARLFEVSVRPNTYADILPADSVMFFEFNDTATTVERFKSTPLSQFWQKQTMRTYWAGHRAGMLANEQKMLDAIWALPKLAAGKAVFALSSPDTIEAHEIDPPLLYVFETNAIQAAEAQIRNMFDGMNDAVKEKRQYKKFQIEEQNNACTVFGSDRIIHSLTAKGIESFLDLLITPPAKALSSLLTELKAKRPKADAYLRLAFNGLNVLAEANQLLDDDLIKNIETAGFTEGGYFEDALTLNKDGVEEFIRFSAGGDNRNKGLLAVLQKMTIKPAPPMLANQPQALDMVPFQAGLVATFNGDASKHAAELAVALRNLDALGGEAIHPEVNLHAAAPAPKAAKPADGGAVAPPRPPTAPKTRAEEALQKGGGAGIDDKDDANVLEKAPKPDDKTPGKKADKPAEPERTTPRIERLARAGFSLEQLLAQADGPLVLALFPERVDITKLANPTAPNNPPDLDHVPLAALFCMYLKDPAPIEMALRKANKGINPRYVEHVLNGGAFFAEDEEENSGGFWLKGNYFAYGTSKDILELAGAAALNQNGTERMSARQSYLDYLKKDYDVGALINIFADSRQFLEMPYKMAQLQWQEDPKNPWPDYAVAGGLLKGNAIHLKIKQVKGGLELEAQTPITILGIIMGIMKPLKEAALIQ